MRASDKSLPFILYGGGKAVRAIWHSNRQPEDKKERKTESQRIAALKVSFDGLEDVTALLSQTTESNTSSDMP